MNTENYTIDHIRNNKGNVDWIWISANMKLSEDEIREFQDRVDWYYISIHQPLSEPFIREFKDKVYWGCISIYQPLSEPFIWEFKDRVNWDCISANQPLSEPFIREFKDRVDWYNISVYQPLSEPFIREFKDRVYWDLISKYQPLTPSFRKEFGLKPPKNNTLFMSRDEKWKLVPPFYERDGDHIIAFKGVRKDRYSALTFRYRYLKGGVYESHCDCNNDNENSFGLSAWTEEKARDYCDELVIRVRIHIDDLGAVVHKGGKLRCRKFEVLS